jgi:hypothetical protein
MKALIMVVLTAALLLWTGCSGALPLDNADAVERPTTGGTGNSPTREPGRPCGALAITLSAACKGAAPGLTN